MKQARAAAADILFAVENDKAYSGLLLTDAIKKAELTDNRDKTLLAALVYGVCEKRITLDYNLSLYLSSPIKKLHPRVLTILRLGAYQLLFMQKIPVSAAVNESVSLAKKSGKAFAAGLINAVLRKVAVNGLVLPQETDRVFFLSVKYSVPKELILHFDKDYGTENTQSILTVAEGRRPVFIRTNTLKTNDDSLIIALISEGVKAQKTEFENCLSVENTGDITSLSAYKNGLFHVQDMSSQMCCKLMDAKPGANIADCCASPGGKSFTLSQYMNNTGKIVACDKYEHRTKLIDDGEKRLGITCINTVCCDALELNKTYSGFDNVLCDVPCSGLGVIGRKPEIRYKSLEEISVLPGIQLAILNSCSKLVKPGGTLIYSTCTLSRNENDCVCNSFLEQNGDFYISDDDFYRNLCSNSKYYTVFPSKTGGDGFFVAKLKRKQ